MSYEPLEKRRLEEVNPWWLQGKVDPELALPFKRTIYTQVEKDLGQRFILALVGLRRVGKTTLLYQLISKLLEDKVSPQSIIFFSFDDTVSSLRKVMEAYQELHQRDFRQEKTYVFLDEIQKCPSWENEVKRSYDLYPKMKFILSGSESLFLRKKTKETLAGRIFEFFLPPFSFKEYLRLQGVGSEEWKYESRMAPFFLKYVRQGGFPETFHFKTEREFKEYVRSLVVDKIIYKDIPKTYHIDDPDFLLMLVELISSNPGLDVDYQSLGQQLGKDRRVIKDYLLYLRQSFLIRFLGNYRKGNITSLRKRKRAYPCDTALTYLFHPQQDSVFFGRVVETIVANALPASWFWKNGHDVDFVVEQLPVEVKYQEQITPQDTQGIKEFLKKFKQREGLLLTKNKEGWLEVPEGRIQMIPVWKWLLRSS